MAECPGKNGEPCGREIIRPNGMVGRPPKYCDKCKMIVTLPGKLTLIDSIPRGIADDIPRIEPQKPFVPTVIEPPGEPGQLYESCRRRLEDLDRMNSPEGVALLAVAAVIDSTGHTDSGLAALFGQWRSLRELAFAGAPVEEDKLSEIARVRRKRYGDI